MCLIIQMVDACDKSLVLVRWRLILLALSCVIRALALQCVSDARAVDSFVPIHFSSLRLLLCFNYWIVLTLFSCVSCYDDNLNDKPDLLWFVYCCGALSVWLNFIVNRTTINMSLTYLLVFELCEMHNKLCCYICYCSFYRDQRNWLLHSAAPCNIVKRGICYQNARPSSGASRHFVWGATRRRGRAPKAQGSRRPLPRKFFQSFIKTACFGRFWCLNVPVTCTHA